MDYVTAVTNPYRQFELVCVHLKKVGAQNSLYILVLFSGRSSQLGGTRDMGHSGTRGWKGEPIVVAPS